MQSGHARKRAWNKDKNAAEPHKCRRGAGFCIVDASFHASVTIAQQPCDGRAKFTAGKNAEFGKRFRRRMRAKNAPLRAELGDLVDEPRYLAAGGVAMNDALLAG